MCVSFCPTMSHLKGLSGSCGESVGPGSSGASPGTTARTGGCSALSQSPMAPIFMRLDIPKGDDPSFSARAKWIVRCGECWFVEIVKERWKVSSSTINIVAGSEAVLGFLGTLPFFLPRRTRRVAGVSPSRPPGPADRSSACVLWDHLDHSGGIGSGRSGLRPSPSNPPALDHRQSTARATSPRRTGF
jgi:hypothetical protein